MPPPHYPESAREATGDLLHGEWVPDPYRWLEDTDSGRTRRWIEEQNALTDAWLAGSGRRADLERRLTRCWDFPRRGLPVVRGDRWFQARNTGLQAQAVIHTGLAGDDVGRTLLDPNLLAKDGTTAATGWSVTRDGAGMAYAVSEAGSDWMTWRVREVATGADLDDEVRWSKFSDAAWLPDGSGFFYCALDEPADGREHLDQSRRPRVQLHRVGDHQDDDVVVFEVAEDDWLPSVATTWDGRHLVVTISRGTNRETMVLVAALAASPSLELTPLIGDFRSSNVVVGTHEGRFLVRTDRDAPRGRVVAIDPDKPDPSRWVDVVEQASDMLVAAVRCGDHLVVHHLHHGSSRLDVHDLDGRPVREVALPSMGTASVQGTPEHPDLFVGFTSFSDPGSLWRIELPTGEPIQVWAAIAGLDLGDLVTEQVFVTSADGTRVPLFLTRRSDVEPTGDVPVLLAGYGGFNVPMTPGFSPSRHVFVLEGGVLATALLRGGGEYGTEWYEGGRLANKQNVFDDFCAGAQWLGDGSGWSRPERIAIVGGSNGGLLVGACLTQRPELFGAAVPVVGVLDMLRFHRFTIGWAWTSDYGDPDDPEQYRWVRAYSPYHRIETGRAYPATLVMTGDHDDRVVPGHSFKFAAALQAAQGGQAPVLIRIETSAGHGAGKPTQKAIREQADLLTFLDRTIGSPRAEPDGARAGQEVQRC